MASGKLSPRQKMINMMYLVLTAMLALNVSRDILKALTRLDDSLAKTVQTVDSKNAEIYSEFAAAAASNPEKAGPWKKKADNVNQKADQLYKEINKMKKELVEVSGGMDENGVPKRLDALEPPANYMLNQGHGEELKKKLNEFESEMVPLVQGHPQIKENIKSTFNTSPQKIGDKMVDWENASFEHFPLGAIIPFLTDLQAKVRNTESDVISVLKSNIGKSDLKFTGVRVVVDEKSSYVTEGGKYQAEVFLAAYDSTQTPEIIVDGQALPESQIKNGRGIIERPANKVGKVTWGGQITITQIGKEPRTYPIEEQSYTVAPQSVVISPTKMNVLYRGVKNPLEIGVPGVDPSKLRVSGPGVSGDNGDYVADVTKVKGKAISIKVAIQEEKDGEMVTRPAGEKKFRIKGLPPAIGTIYTKSSGTFSKSAVSRAEIEAEFKDFPFNLPLTVTSFEIAIPGFPPEKVNGSTIPQRAKQRINSLKPGQTISIRNIKARAKSSGARVTQVGNISVDIN